MDFLKTLVENEMVVTLLCGAALYVGKKIIERVTVKWPLLKKLKLQEKLERVIDRVKEQKLAHSAKDVQLTRGEIHSLVAAYAKEEGVKADDVILHRRALKRAEKGRSLYGKVGMSGRNPYGEIGGSISF